MGTSVLEDLLIHDETISNDDTILNDASKVHSTMTLSSSASIVAVILLVGSPAGSLDIVS